MSAPADTWVDYDYAFIRVVPHVHVGTFATVGVVVSLALDREVAVQHPHGGQLHAA